MEENAIATVEIPVRHAGGNGSILCEAAWAKQARLEWFDAAHWGDAATPVGSGGRGGAYFVHGPFGDAVLRRYLRGGAMARFSRDAYLWRGSENTRGFAEFRLLRDMQARGLPVPAPIAAAWWRDGLTYRAAILIARIPAARSLADCMTADGDSAPWEATGALIARFHRHGVQHADLNAHNILFDAEGKGWLIDFDKGRIRTGGDDWCETNLQRLRRSLLKLRGSRPADAVEGDFARIRDAYAQAWQNPAS